MDTKSNMGEIWDFLGKANEGPQTVQPENMPSSPFRPGTLVVYSEINSEMRNSFKHFIEQVTISRLLFALF
jgi:hypothetical protein